MPKPNGRMSDEATLRDQLVSLDLQIADHSDAIKALKKAQAQTIADLRACQQDRARPMFQVMEVVDGNEERE
jgi:hypothetical protein